MKDIAGTRSGLIVFLSSVYWEVKGEEFVELPVRAKLRELASTLSIEIRAPVMRSSEGAETGDQIIDRCFKDIREADVFVYLRTRRHGSAVRFPESDATVVTYLEMELFAAAMLGKRILVLHERGMEAESQLADLLGLLRQSSGPEAYVQGDEAELISAFTSYIRDLEVSTVRRAPKRHRMAFPDRLSRLRARRSIIRDLDEPALLFLGGFQSQASAGGDLDVATRLLDTIASSDRSGAAALSHGAALFRIWAALREFIAYDRRDANVRALWDRALDMWTIKASWFGIHGHILMGPLAATNTQIELRRAYGVPETEGLMREPLDARASALYSVAQRMETRACQIRYFEQSALQATQAIQVAATDFSNALAIRGSANLRLARLGRPWRLFDARGDFRAVLGERERRSAPEASIGEAETDLGLVMIMTGQPFAGFERMRRGVAMMRADQTPNGLANLARGLRKLEEAARLTLRRQLAGKVRSERETIASGIDAVDQMRKS
jgi:hypothetical protein